MVDTCAKQDFNIIVIIIFTFLQGLAGFCEKSENPDLKTELVDVYSHLGELLVTKDNKKWLDVSEKLAKLHCQLGKTQEVSQGVPLSLCFT